MDVCRVTRPEPVPDPRRPARAAAGLPAARRAPAPLRVRPRHRHDDRDPARRRQHRVPVDRPRAGGARARYAYNVHVADAETVLFDGLLRYDQSPARGRRTGSGRAGSAARPRSRRGRAPTGDDDGYLVSFVTDERDGRSEVEILDASDIAAGPVARVQLPQRVPLGFHATWVRADQLRRPTEG